MHKLRDELFRLEPKIDLLHDLLGLGRFAEITITSDGYFLGRRPGDVGLNDFLGWPSDAAIERTRILFRKLSPDSQDKVVLIFFRKRFPLTLLKDGKPAFAVNRKKVQMME
ncbi:hypothetical protein BVY01_00795 [bacterium I07]|nr:hypothetical protein BVY01_00795 [bacterium I07]